MINRGQSERKRNIFVNIFIILLWTSQERVNLLMIIHPAKVTRVMTLAPFRPWCPKSQLKHPQKKKFHSAAPHLGHSPVLNTALSPQCGPVSPTHSNHSRQLRPIFWAQANKYPTIIKSKPDRSSQIYYLNSQGHLMQHSVKVQSGCWRQHSQEALTRTTCVIRHDWPLSSH